MAYELEKIESEFKKIWKAIEELQMTRQAKDEFRAEIWQAIEGLQEKQDSLENGPKVSVLCRKCKAENMVYDCAQWEYTCRKCGFDHANEYNDDEPKEPDCRALYEKERERWKKLKAELLKMKGAYREELHFMSQNNEAREMPETKRVLLNVVLRKMQELEAG